jgi:hypothetical protein
MERELMAAQIAPEDQRAELADQRRRVDFDTYDVTVDELLRRVARRRIDIAPIYQRQFRWDFARQSRLIESVLLGIPVPPLFMATNSSVDNQNQWEVVDGLQRLLTLVNFAGDEDARVAAKLDNEKTLILTDMDKLTKFDGFEFASLPDDIRTAFEDRPIRVVVLNDKSDLQVRYDLFERLNTGGVRLTPQEIRECVYRGAFMNLLDELAHTQDFRKVVILAENRWKDGTPQDFVLRFFAFLENYRHFSHLVDSFLKDFTDAAHKDPRVEERRSVFEQTFGFLARCFPEGLTGKSGQTPVNLFEGVSAGCALALKQDSQLHPVVDPPWIRSDDLRRFTTAATNTRPKVRGRIEYCRDQFLADAD